MDEDGEPGSEIYGYHYIGYRIIKATIAVIQTEGNSNRIGSDGSGRGLRSVDHLTYQDRVVVLSTKSNLQMAT